MRRCPQGMPMAENPENRQYWYALRVTYGREMLVKGYLDGIGVESYIPMHFARRTYRGADAQGLGAAHPQSAVHPHFGPAPEGDQGQHHPADPLHHGSGDKGADGDTGQPDAGFHGGRGDTQRACRDRGTAGRRPGRRRCRPRDRRGVRRDRGPLHPAQGHSKVAVAIKDIATALTAYVPLRYIEKNKSADPSSHTYAICATLIRKLTPLNFRL